MDRDDRKRRARPEESSAGAPAGAAAATSADAITAGLEELEFEDPYEDVFEEEEDDDDGGYGDDDDGDGGGAELQGEAGAPPAAKPRQRAAAAAGMDEEDDDDGDAAGGAAAARSGGRDVFRPGMDALGDGEDLDFDPSAYVMYHTMDAEWPCLSFDVMPDRLGTGRTKFPLSAMVVAGTQADRPGANELILMRMSSLHKTQPRREEDEEEDDERGDDEDDEDDHLDDDPILEAQRIAHPSGTVNRVRVMPQGPHVVATWSEAGRVHLWDVRPQLALLDAAAGKGAAPPVPAGYGPAMSFAGHGQEGYALDWSPVTPGRLASGDCGGGIHVWEPDSAAAAAAVGAGGGGGGGGVWSVDAGKRYAGHSGSVEDLQWSPNEATVFASCSADKSLRIWDTRVSSRSMLAVQGADCDVNVLSWSRLVSYLLASGADDGSFSIWDLRAFKADNAIAHFAWHTQQVTGIEWAPDDENVLAVCSADGTTTLWDMSLEEDEEAELALTEGGKKKPASGSKPRVMPSTQDARLKAIPPQLLFLHAGQKVTKEVHWHRQLPGVLMTTAFDGLNVLKPDVYTTH